MCNCTRTFALLIDTENVNIKYVDAIMNKCSEKGNISIRRAYGSIEDPCFIKLKDKLIEYAITPIQQFNYVSGKNSSDIRMVVDAIDILYNTNPDGFILVSSDSDFTSLAIVLKEKGKIVIGMGKKNTPVAFIKACNEFKYVDLEELSSDNKGNSITSDSHKIPDSAPSRKELKQFIKKILNDSDKDEEWIRLSEIGSQIKNKYPDFDSRIYGCKTTTILLKELGFETKSTDDKNNMINGGKIVFIRNR